MLREFTQREESSETEKSIIDKIAEFFDKFFDRIEAFFKPTYETELNNYTKGKIRFPFRNLAKGLHTITFKAWDVYNNYVTAEIQFIVADSENVTLTNVLNYPNPFVNYTQFWVNGFSD